MTMASLTNIKKADSLGETIKLGAGMVLGFAAEMAVAALLKQHIPVSKGITKVLIKLGIFAVAMKIGDDVETYVYKVSDEAKEAFAEAKEEAKKAVQEAMTAPEEPPAE